MLANQPPFSFDGIAAEELDALRRQPDGSLDSRPLSALCISGGGIRSATFGLGALQGLADQGILTEFDYLSTVSGGGYIGGWLTSWKHREDGLDKILPKLRSDASFADPGGMDPVSYLREYNNYLSPKLGFFSADTWTLAATVMRNMALNWLVLMPLLLFALMLPRLILALWRLQQVNPGTVPASLSTPLRLATAALFAMAIRNAMRYLPGVGEKNHTEADFLKYCLTPLVLATLGFITYDAWFDGPVVPFSAILMWITGACVAGWLGFLLTGAKTMQGKVYLILPLSVAIVLTGLCTATGAWILVNKVWTQGTWASYTTIGPPMLLLSFMVAGGLFIGFTSRVLGDADREWLSRGAAWILLSIVCWIAICGLVLMAPTWVFQLNASWMQAGLAATGGVAGWVSAIAGFQSESSSQGNGASTAASKFLSLDLLGKVAAPVFIAALIVGLSTLTSWLLSSLQVAPANWFGDYESFIEGTGPYIVLAGALIALGIGWFAARFININKFSLHAMYRSRLIRAYLGASNRRSDVNKFIGFADSDNIRMSQLKPGLKPFHVVNITLNLVAGERLAWQQRKAESFTVSPLHAGSWRLGYRPSSNYAGRPGISMGTAITISGAAASPNMGYHSAGALGFIMTLFNARLGAWLGNPGPAGNRTWTEEGPSSAVASLVKEAFGLTNDKSAYVYLSDGGHFENLGLYEMVMRRCRNIVVLDSGCDPNFIYEDLGNALRKIRIDLGIAIDFEDGGFKRLQQKRCAIARIRYSANPDEDGTLLYIKPVMTGTEPPDVATYRASHPDFPHQSTANQWFDESQTESYRMLGLHTIRELGAGYQPAQGLAGWVNHLRESYLRDDHALTAGA